MRLDGGRARDGCAHEGVLERVERDGRAEGDGAVTEMRYDGLLEGHELALIRDAEVRLCSRIIQGRWGVAYRWRRPAPSGRSWRQR